MYGPGDWDGSRYLDQLGFPGEAHRSPVASIPRCTGVAPGRSASSSDWARRPTTTSASAICWPTEPPPSRCCRATPASAVSTAMRYRSRCSARAARWSTASTTWMPPSMACPSTTISTAMNDPTPFTLLAFVLGVAKRQGRPVRPHHRNVESVRLHLALRRQPHVLPAVAARLPAPAGRPCRVLPPGRAQLEPRSRSSASTCSRPGPPQPRRWASPCPPPSSTPRTAWPGAWIPTRSCPRFTFFFDISISLFEEVAKFRAGRRIWARLTRGAARGP